MISIFFQYGVLFFSSIKNTITSLFSLKVAPEQQNRPAVIIFLEQSFFSPLPTFDPSPNAR